MLQGWKGVRYHPWLRGSIDGIEPAEMRGLLSFRDRFRRGTFTHVFLHARLEQRYADREREDRSEGKPGAGSKKEGILASVRKLRKLVERIGWEPPEGVWTAYGERNSYTDDDTKRKEEFVRAVAGGERFGLTWDIWSINGRSSRDA